MTQNTHEARRDQRATLPAAHVSNARNMRDERETVRQAHLVGVYKGAARTLARVDWYMARSADGAGPVYCSIWIHHASGPAYATPRVFAGASGHGRAGGYGYHKPSAALAEALSSAGVTLAKPIDGRGETAERAALYAIAAALGYRRALIVD